MYSNLPFTKFDNFVVKFNVHSPVVGYVAAVDIVNISLNIW
jgi:hypothetical protein